MSTEEHYTLKEQRRIIDIIPVLKLLNGHLYSEQVGNYLRKVRIEMAEQ